MDKQKNARERIEKLFEEARKTFRKNSKLADRYVTLARKIAMKTRISIPREFKRKFCKHCYKYLQPGVNCRVRNHKSRIIYYCMECKKYMRFQLK